jgi:hypothetical protein
MNISRDCFPWLYAYAGVPFRSQAFYPPLVVALEVQTDGSTSYMGSKPTEKDFHSSTDYAEETPNVKSIWPANAAHGPTCSKNLRHRSCGGGAKSKRSHHV